MRWRIALAAVALAACADDPAFPPVVGTRAVPDGLRLCQAYGASPYRAVTADGAPVPRHPGNDFCAPTGTPVIAVATGRVAAVVADSPLDGGSVAIELPVAVATGAPGFAPGGTALARVLHIVPRPDLRPGMTVRAGEPIGRLQDPAAIVNVRWPHAHLEISMCPGKPYRCSADPDAFWRDGPGRVSCDAPDRPPPAGRIVAPLRCVR